jgi:transposase
LKRRRVALRRAGRNPAELAEQVEPTAQSIRTWVQADRDAGRRAEGLPPAERDESRRLRRAVQTHREAREHLTNAATGFAGEPSSLPPKDARA